MAHIDVKQRGVDNSGVTATKEIGIRGNKDGRLTANAKENSKCASREKHIEEALKKHPEYRDPRKIGVNNIFLLLPPIPSPVSNVKKIDKKEAEKRLSELKESIVKAHTKGFRFAASQMSYWLKGSGKMLQLDKMQLTKYQEVISNSIRESHKELLWGGVKKRLNTKDPEYIDTDTKCTIYLQSKLKWSDIIGFKVFLKAKKSHFQSFDLFIGLGTSQVTSKLTVRRIGSSNRVQVLRWSIQIYDIYNWERGAKTGIPVPNSWIDKIPIPKDAREFESGALGWTLLKIKDSWFRELERFGIGKQFEQVSTIFPLRIKPEERIIKT